MADREQITLVSRWNRVLAGENRRLRTRLRQVEHECRATGAELTAAQVLLGEAMDAALGEKPR